MTALAHRLSSDGRLSYYPPTGLFPYSPYHNQHCYSIPLYPQFSNVKSVPYQSHDVFKPDNTAELNFSINNILKPDHGYSSPTNHDLNFMANVYKLINDRLPHLPRAIGDLPKFETYTAFAEPLPIVNANLDSRTFDDLKCKQPELPTSSSNPADHVIAATTITDKRRRTRTIFTPYQMRILEAEFQKTQYMVGQARIHLANSLNLQEQQVKIWFQNRRIKWRKNQQPILSKRTD